MEIVLIPIFPVDDQIDAVLVNQVFILLLHKSHNDINLMYARLMKLPDQALYKRFSAYLYESLGNLTVDGDHAHPVSSRQDNGVLWLLLLYFLHCPVCQSILLIQIPILHQSGQRLIDFSQGISCAL